MTNPIAFPLKIPVLEDITNKIPKMINQNKQLYEILFSALQNHPCYLMNIFLLRKFSNPNDFITLVKSVHGYFEIYNDERKIHLLMCLAQMVFIKEVQIIFIFHE